MATAPYGSWPSPIDADLVATGGVQVNTIEMNGDHLFWSESRPSEGGRVALISAAVGEEPDELIGEEFSARSLVHLYGGGAHWLGRDNLYFVNLDDQRIYSVPQAGGEPKPLTPEPAIGKGWRFADGFESPDGDWIYCVREDHHGIGEGDKTEEANEIVAVPTDGSLTMTVLVSGPDFVAAPRVSPDGRWLSYLSWNHPNMPWDGTELCAAPMFSGPRLGNTVVVAGGPHESIVCPLWHSDGRLIFSTDTSGFWNLSSWHPGTDKTKTLTELSDAEVGGPAWVFGVQRWVEVTDGRIVCAVTRNAVDHLMVIGLDGEAANLESDYRRFASLRPTGHGTVMAVGYSPTAMPDIVEFDPDSGAKRIRRHGEDLGVDTSWFSIPSALDFPSANGRICHAFVYPPSGPAMEGPEDDLPPLVVMGHGGPTAHTSPQLSLKINYWTSRGFAVADVNYGGSSGYGRAYRELLQGQWGIIDVEDCISVAEHLAEAGRVDPARCVIRGGSAGGLTVLMALATSEVFSGGTSLYGVAELAALATDTHKFESRYLDGLIGPYPEAASVYEERSPINHAADIAAPLLVLQGLDDEVVPPSQSEAIVAAVAASGLPHAAIYFEGEQHGFRMADTIVRSLEAELWFYGRVLGFEPADEISPVEGAVDL